MFYNRNDDKYFVVSGKNYILKFSIDNLASPIDIRHTGPVNDSILCTEPNRCSMIICSNELKSQDKCKQKPTDVYVKSWTIAQSNLIVCYNVYQGYCETIDLYGNFSSPPRGKGYSIVTYDLNSHSTILHFQNKLYVAIEINTLLNFLSIDFNTISIRTLPNIDIITSNEVQLFYPYYGRFGTGLKMIFPLEFKGSFHIHDGRKHVIATDYIFFLINQPENKLDPKNGKFQMRLVRLCAKDDDFSSLIDVGLYCQNDKAQTYYQIDSWYLAHVTDDEAKWYRNNTRFPNIRDELEANFNQILFINLKTIRITDNYKETLESFVICAFPIAEIMELFDIVKNKCFIGEGSVNERPYDINSNDISCSKEFMDLKRGNCGGKIKNKHIIGDHSGENSAIGYKILIKDGVRGSSLIVFQIYDKHTISLIGGSDGVLYMYELFEGKYQQLGSHMLFDGHKFDMILNEDNTTVFAVSNSEIVVKDFKSCDNASTCEMCLRLSLFCGWCLGNGKCVLRSDCIKQFWIPYERNNEINMCPEIRYLPSHSVLEYSNTIPEIHFQITKTPDTVFSANSQFLKCQFLVNNDILIATVKAHYYSNNYSVACKGPSRHDIPSIRDNKNYIDFKLRVLINESYLVESVYYIYNCAHSKTCSRCTDNQFNCTWCVLDNLCVAAHTSKCKKNYEIDSNMSQKCPNLEIPNKTLAFHVDSSIFIDLIIKKIENYFSVKTDFFCFETCENSTVRAILIPKSGSIRCSFNKIKLVKNGQIKCSVSVIWRLANSLSGTIESYNQIEFQIFDCAKLSQHCDDCVLLPPIYQCGFCSSKESCVQKQKCGNAITWINQKTQACPSPIITEIIPQNSTLSSETIILIKGRNLGFHERDIQNSISLENARLHISCRFIDRLFISAKQFMCKIQNVTDQIDTPVIFHFVFRSKLPHLAKKEFYFFTPNVESIKPDFGPFIGGTIIEISGRYLNIGFKRQINFKCGNIKIPCKPLENSENRIFCQIEEFISNSQLVRFKRSIDLPKASLQLIIDRNIIQFKNIFYNFFPNPNVIKISRTKFLSGGGQMIAFTGENLKLIHKPSLAFYCNRKLSIYENCWSNEDDIHCFTPETTYVNKSQECELRLGMEKGTVSLYNTTVNIFPSPLLKKTRDKINLPLTSFSFIKAKPVNDKIPISFEIKDPNSVNSFIESDIHVSIDSLSCTNVTLSEKIIHCKITISLINIYQKYSVIIKIGRNLVINLGFIQFEKGDISLDTTSVIIITVIITIIISVIIIMSIVIVRKVQQKQKSKDRKQNIFTEKVIKEAQEVMKLGITELNKVSIQDEIHKNWNTAPIYPYNVYILYNLFPNIHPRLFNENKNISECIFDLNYYKYDSSDPTSHPLIFNKQIQVIENTIEYSRKLSKLFEDELFVLMFFSFLEDHQEVDSKKSDIISFLSLILMKDMCNYTKILKILIKNDYDRKKVMDEEKSMFRQSDLLSRLLSNWFFILMYDHLQNINAGGDLLILYLNILSVINNGPVNHVTNKCQYSLNENLLLDGKVEFNKLHLTVKHELSEGESELALDALDCDCITQVKLKIFEDIYKYTPFSNWSNLDDYDLVKVDQTDIPENEQLIKSVILKELVNDSYKTLKDYGIKNEDVLHMISKNCSASGSIAASVSHSFQLESNSASLKTNRSRNITKDAFNFTPEIFKKTPIHKLSNNLYDKSSEENQLLCCCKAKSNITKDSDIKQVCLIYTQVLKTRIEQQIKNVFDDIFDCDSIPYCVIDLFTYFNNICKDDNVIFAVKSNSLILRFWIQLINNIDFLFDIPLVRHTPVLECLKCISRVLMDICSENQNKDVWLTQLFLDMIKTYSPKVLNYYEGVKTPPNCNYSDYYASTKFDGINISLAIVILYQNYIKCVHDQLVEVILSSNYPKNKQNEWILILKEVNNLYIPEPFLSEGNGNVKTTVC